MRKSISIFAILLLFAFELSAQISWISKPRNFQFVSRDLSTRKGKVVFEGWVNQPGFTSCQIEHRVSSGTKVKYTIPLVYNGSGLAYFYQVININSGKINHDFDVVLNTGTSTLVAASIGNIICGDAYLITGQSNSVANAYNGLSNPLYRDSFIRSYGSSSPSIAGANDTGWYVADGDGLYNKGCIGQWGLVMAKHILDSAGIPICMINAGVGGTPITFHQKNKLNAEDLNTNYGRMLYRTKKAGINEKIRGVFWFQGESDGSNAVLHDTLFRIMHADWFRDYRGLEKVAVVQVRSGCGGPSLQLREKQRLFENLGRTVVISANGLNAHDGCHYGFKNGYEKLGILLFHQLKTQLYNLKSTPENQPLNPSLIYFSNSAKTELCVEMTPLKATLKTTAGFHRLFSLSGGTVFITGGYLKNNKLYLTLSGTGCGIKYLNYDGFAGNQPWVSTLADATLISFYQFPVLPVKPLPNIAICSGDKALLGNDSITGNTYSWKGVLSGMTSKLARPSLKVPKSEKFWCIMQSTASGCNYDTFSQNVIVDTISPASFPDTLCTCPGDSVSMGSLKTDWVSGAWRNKRAFYSTLIIKVSDTGLWCFTAVNKSGCKTNDSIFLLHYSPPNKFLPVSLEMCQGTKMKLTGPSRSSQLLWNNTFSKDTCGISSFDRYVKLRYLDSNFCTRYDSALIVELIPGSITLDSFYVFCAGKTQKLTRPVTYSRWSCNGSDIHDDTFLLTQKSTYHFTLTDSKGCKKFHSIKTEWHPVMQWPAIDTGICLGDSVYIKKPGWINSWTWNKDTAPSLFYLKKEGIYDAVWKDTNQCSGNTVIKIKTASKAKFNLPSDTFYCSNDSLVLNGAISRSQNEFLTGKPMMYPLVIKQPGNYTFTAYDESYCQSQLTLHVWEKICESSALKAFPEKIRIARSEEGLRIYNDDAYTIEYRIYNTDARLLLCSRVGKGEIQDIRIRPGVYFLGVVYGNGQKIVLRKEVVY